MQSLPSGVAITLWHDAKSIALSFIPIPDQVARMPIVKFLITMALNAIALPGLLNSITTLKKLQPQEEPEPISYILA
jgi:hypothetical protein